MTILYDRWAEVDDIYAIWNYCNNYEMIYFCWFYMGEHWDL